MGVNWTEEQRKVIELRDCNILVSAAAGSGKTAVLVERILAMLTDERKPVDIDHLLIVTFTNAAAGEMKDRIRAAIEKKLEDEETDAKILEHLQRQTALLQNAQITTIHSFCQYVIRNHFHTIDLDPSFRIADEGEQKLMQGDVLEKLIEEKYAEKTESFQRMVECFCTGRDDHEIAELVLQLYRFSMSAPWPGKWLSQCKAAYEAESVEEFVSSEWMGQLMELAALTLGDVHEQAEAALRITEEEDGPYMYADAVISDIEQIEELMNAADYRECSRKFRELPVWMRLSAKKDPAVSELKKESVKELREQYKKAVKDLREEYFYAAPETLFWHMKASALPMGELLDLTAAFTERFAQEKRRKNLLDFNDLEHFALEILLKEQDGEMVRTAVARDFADYYAEIMIDEYQDSNQVQEMILNSISKIEDGSYNVFMVGDVKQSIYRFRLARPELFMEKYRTYAQEEGECRRVDLHKNFRSREQVLEGVNFIFEQIMEEHLGNVQYDEAAALYPGAVFEKTEREEFFDTEILLVDTKSGEEGKETEENARELEAHVLGNKIREIVGHEQVWDKQKNAYRPAGYGDIVILLRTVSGWAEVFAKVLGEMGIPAHTGSRTGYFSTIEIQTVLAFLKLIDNPNQDIPMASVLHSPIVGLSGEELAQIKSTHRETTFYEACMAEESLHGFFEMLEDFREKAVYMPMHELLWEIYERTGYGAYAAAMPGGAQRKANLEMLVEKAIVYEAGSYRGLYNFIRYIENLHKYDVDFGEAAMGNEEEQNVRIMSIHKSKGLEFPIVFVAGMGKRINQTDARTPLILHAGLGAGCDYTDPVLRIRTNTLLKRMMKHQIVYENLGEELRVLYVALTRAKEKLILTGSVEGVADKMKKWGRICRRKEKTLSFSERAGASCYWDWIMPSLLRNRCCEELAAEYELMQNRHHPLFEREIHCRIRVVGISDLIEEEARRQFSYAMAKEELLKLPVDMAFDDQARKILEDRFCYRYPFEKNRNIPNKVSVSELKKLSQAESMAEGAVLYEEAVPIPLVPEFLKKEKEVSGASRGTIYHKVMECLDFAGLGNSSEKNTESTQNYGKIQSEIRHMVQNGQLEEEEASLLDLQKISLFLDSKLAKRMIKAAGEGKLFRERQFVMSVEASQISRDWTSDESVLIQGIIDAYFIEDGQIVLLDYKTDSVNREEASSLYEKYRVQLEYYKIALERLTGLPVKEQCIYSFCLNCVITGMDGELEQIEE